MKRPYMKNKLPLFFSLLFIMLFAGKQQLHAQVPEIKSFFPHKGYIGGLVTIKGKDMQYSASVKIGNAKELIISIEDTEVVVMVMPGTVTANDIKIIALSGGSSIYAD